MKKYFAAAIVSIAVALIIFGCGATARTGKQSATNQTEKDKSDIAVSNSKIENGPTRQPEEKGGAPGRYEPPMNDKPIAGDGDVDQTQRAEVTRSALEFADKNIPDVKHIKVCYSKLYGGWYTLLYIQKGKKLSMQHWAWNAKSKEWEVVYQRKELSPSQMEFDLKSDVSGEKCYRVK
jgi:hypothetical protein